MNAVSAKLTFDSWHEKIAIENLNFVLPGTLKQVYFIYLKYLLQPWSFSNNLSHVFVALLSTAQATSQNIRDFMYGRHVVWPQCNSHIVAMFPAHICARYWYKIARLYCCNTKNKDDKTCTLQGTNNGWLRDLDTITQKTSLKSC